MLGTISGAVRILVKYTQIVKSTSNCIEIVSPFDSEAEIREKRALYFDAGATEVWIPNLDGSMSFFFAPNQQSVASTICPNFLTSIP
jgi:hypothetical protein